MAAIFKNDIFKFILLNENIQISISLKIVLKVPINNIPALVQIMAWRRPGDKPLWLVLWRIYASLNLNLLTGIYHFIKIYHLYPAINIQ